jgi:hypothetical protein
MFICDACGAAHAEPPRRLVPSRQLGDHRPIYDCAFCSQEICISCYVDHNARVHLDLYRTKRKR